MIGHQLDYREIYTKIQIMKDRCYIPFSMTIRGKPVIVYLLKGNSSLNRVYDPNSKKNVCAHIRSIYAKHEILLKGGIYHIVFLWILNNRPMTDIWIHNVNKIDGPSGPLQKAYTFRDLNKFDIEISSGDTLIVLAREEELRRKVGNLEKYTQRPKYIPDFPLDMQPYEDFFT